MRLERPLDSEGKINFLGSIVEKNRYPTEGSVFKLYATYSAIRSPHADIAQKRSLVPIYMTGVRQENLTLYTFTLFSYCCGHGTLRLGMPIFESSSTNIA
jgi:hypothetical protein